MKIFILAVGTFLAAPAVADIIKLDLGNMRRGSIARTYNSASGMLCFVFQGDGVAMSCVKRPGKSLPLFADLGDFSSFQVFKDGKVASFTDDNAQVECVVARGDGAAISCF